MTAPSATIVEQALRGDGLCLQVSSFRFLIKSDTGLLSTPLSLLYRDYPWSVETDGFFDARIELRKKSGGIGRPKEVEFTWEGNSPLPSLPLSQSHPLFEWGLNWCLATLCGTEIVIHSAVVERNGRALVLPGDPGSGKSTLSAGLCLRGWRLLSDELTIISVGTGLVQPLPRPISLKDKSIKVIREHFPSAEMTIPVRETRKGAIAYVKPPFESVSACSRTVPLGHIIFPRYVADAPLVASPMQRSASLIRMLENTFNVGLIGAAGFATLARTVADSVSVELEYGSLPAAVEWIETHCR